MLSNIVHVSGAESAALPGVAVQAEKNPFLLALGERVRALRARRGMTRKAVAQAAEVSERHLANLEYGEGNVSILLLLQVAQALQTGAPLSVVMSDLDHFKAVNDTHGHLAGDAVLAAFGAQLRQNSRASDVVARFGGEEFLVLMPETPLASALEWAERMRALCERTTVAPLPAPVTVSLGVATLQHSAANSDDAIRQLVQDADAALYQAKRTGRNRVAVAAGTA